jgi:hypothetical protein
LRTYSRELREHLLTISADGTTGSLKNASANSQMRTRSLRPTSGRTWMRSAVPLLEGPRWPLRPRSAASDLTRQAPPPEVARTAVLSPRHRRPGVRRGLARSRESTRYVFIFRCGFFGVASFPAFVLLSWLLCLRCHLGFTATGIHPHACRPFACDLSAPPYCLLYCRQYCCKVESLHSSNARMITLQRDFLTTGQRSS